MVAPVPHFVDIGYWIAFFNVRDRLHPRARRLAQHLRGPLITTTTILLEVGDAFAGVSVRHLGRQYLQTVRGDPTVEVVALTADVIDKAVDLYLSPSR